ncbi:CDGSH iron-sulfur domain-containing protein [Planctomycetaceae bacterium SH139]|jgi:CDGSH-type Zn-finger protein
MSDTKICCNPKGPIIVEGDVEITDKYGRPLAKEKRKKMHVFCGCGRSLTKPFCDGAHNQDGDDDDDDGLDDI